jgi:hypothetical protein
LGGFDIVIGNPPFESEFSAPAKRVNEKRSGDGVKIPDKQIAYLFLEQAFQVANDNGVICLIQPSGFLYNVKAANIRSRVFGEHQVTFVLDFASIRKLFDEADPKAIAIIARKRPSSAASSILHLTFRRTASVHERIAFELDHYDRHVLSQRQAMENDLIWKFNLLGGGRIGAVCDRFRDISKFASFVNRESEWRYSEGFNAGQKKPAEFLTGLPYLPENKLRDGTIELTTLEPLTDVYFEAPRKKELYNAPLMLIGETLDLPVGILMKGKVAFSKQIVGLSVPVTDSANLLAVFEAFLKRKLLYRFWIAVRSSRAMASMATSILKADIDSLPFSFDDDEFELCFWETVIAEDVLTHLSEFVRLGQNSRLLMESATNTDLRSFADVYCRMLGSIYENLRAAEPIFLDGLICQPFYFGEKPSIKWLDSECQGHISKLVYDKTVVSLQTTRVVRIYHENVIFIVKPDRLRYWIRSTAIRDADDTFVEMKKQGF